MKMSYYTDRGFIGEYKGIEIYVVDVKDYDPLNTRYWQALPDSKSGKLQLMHGADWIGWLDNDGRIERFKSPRKREKQKKEVKPQTSVLLEPDEIAAKAETIVDSYLAWVEKEWWPSLDNN